MKKLLSIFCLTLIAMQYSFAQKTNNQYRLPADNVRLTTKNINYVLIPNNATVHFVSPEPIDYVDISSEDVQGDMPDKYIFRLKPDTSKLHANDDFVVTIVSKSYITVYKLRISPENYKGQTYVITINPNNAIQTERADVLSQQQSFDLALMAMKKKRSIFNVKASAYDMDFWVNNIYSMGDYIMFDVEAKNKSKLQFNIDQIRFKVIDKKLVKATVSQDIELKPVYSLYPAEGKVIRGKWRNFYIFKKFTFPTDKLFSIELNEEQYSGRRVELKVEYKQVLNSEQLN